MDEEPLGASIFVSWIDLINFPLIYTSIYVLSTLTIKCTQVWRGKLSVTVTDTGVLPVFLVYS